MVRITYIDNSTRIELDEKYFQEVVMVYCKKLVKDYTYIRTNNAKHLEKEVEFRSNKDKNNIYVGI